MRRQQLKEKMIFPLQYKDVKMGRLLPTFNDGDFQDITFCVTEQCNFRCSYCYMSGKNDKHVMSIETAKKAVDYILKLPVKFPAAAWNFIGGEPTLEMELVDRITDYIKMRLYEENHPWFNHSAFLIETNGYLYDDEKVQRYREKNRNAVQFAITIDGTKEKHDISRITAAGEGTYDVVEKNVKLWIYQTPGPQMTKSTFSSNDLPYLCDSIINLWQIGLEFVAANVVFENVWKEGDLEVYEGQLRKLADYILDNELWDQFSVRFFDPHVGHPIDENQKKKNFCGTGIMITVGTDGRLFPCIRFLDFCMSNAHKGFHVGNVYDGIDDNRLDVFRKLNIETVSDKECLSCQMSSGCTSCAGNCYDDTNGLSLYHRSKYHCEMQKRQVKVNRYFWKEYSKQTGLVSPFQYNRFSVYKENNWLFEGSKYLLILADSDVSFFCKKSAANSTPHQDNQVIMKSIEFAEENGFFPIITTHDLGSLSEEVLFSAHWVIAHVSGQYSTKSPVQHAIPLYSTIKDVEEYSPWDCDECLLILNECEVLELDHALGVLSKNYQKIMYYTLSRSQWKENSVGVLNEAISHYTGIMSGCFEEVLERSICSNEIGQLFLCPGFAAHSKPNNSHVIGSLESGLTTGYRQLCQNKVIKKQCCSSECLFERFCKTGEICSGWYEQNV